MRRFYPTFAKILLTGLLLVMTAGAMNAQLPFTRSYFSGPYTSIVGGPGTVLQTLTGDDAVQTGIGIGFSFNYLGTNFASFDANTNGAVAFTGSGLTNTAANANLFSATTPNGIITAWWDDMRVDPTGGFYTQLSGVSPNQVLTMEWANNPSYYTGSTQLLNFQIKLYETTNVIEFQYGPVVAGTANTSESASIGCKSTVGGAGNWLDVVTGSANTGNYFINSTTGWPTRHYRLTPGAPAPLPAGVYTAGSTGVYPNLSEAVADVNHRGVAGPVVISLTDANYDLTPAGGDNWFPVVLGSIAGTSPVNTVLIQPASGTSTLTYPGTITGGVANATTTTAVTTSSEPILALVGSDFVGISNLNLTSGGNANLDRGLAVLNNSATNGAQNNAYSNINITLNRTNTSTIGIEQRLPTTPTAATGANSNNVYGGLNIQNTYAGIYLLGNATFPDLGCQIGTSNPTAFNTIGAATANDIGGGTVATYGIRTGNQSGGSIFNNIVQNVGSTTAGADGILVELAQGITSVHRNKVQNILGTNSANTSNITGIRANVATTGTHELRVYNNGVCNVNSAYTGAATAIRAVKGIFVQSAGGGVTTCSINVDNNTVYLNHSANPNISSNCYEIGTSSGPIINTRNNIFVNATAGQTSPAIHLGIRSTSATLMGNTGSVSDRNDVFIADAVQGFFGQGNATNYADVVAWQAGMVGFDANSIGADPVLVNPAICDLHASSSFVNGTASPLAWVTVDVDNQARNATTPDMGYDEFTPTTLDAGASAIVTPAAGACYTAAQAVTVRVRNYAAVTLDMSVNNVGVVVNVTGAATATLPLVINTGTIPASGFVDVIVGNINMSAAGTYTFNASASVIGDQNATNDAMTPAVNITFSGGTASSTPPSVCDGDSITLTLAGQNGTSFQWQSSTDAGLTWNNIPSGTTSPFLAAINDTTSFRALVCGLITSTTTSALWVPTVAPTVQGDTVCGTNQANLTAFGNPNFVWFTVPSGGSPVFTGANYTPTVSTTTNYYVASATGSQSAMHTTTYAAGNGSAGNAFTIKALTNITITGFDGHTSTTAAGDWEIWYRPNDYLLTAGSHLSNAGWTQLGVATNVPALGPGLVTPIPLVLSVPIPAGATYSFQIFKTNGSVSYTNGTTLGALFNANPDLEVYQGHGGTAFAGMANQPRVFNGNIHYSSGCESPRTMVTATVVPADPITASASSSFSCGGDSVALSVTSSNAGYNYSWTPSLTLNTGAGSTVNAGPTGATTYIVSALDAAGCQEYDTISVDYFNKPAVNAVATPDTLCAGDSTLLEALVGANFFQVGNGTVTNSGTSYPAPFGNYWWGSRHQMLILASELSALNVSAGFLTSMAFDATNLNGTQPLVNYEVKLALTNVASIATFQAPVFTSVFSSANYTPVLGFNTDVFTTPFYWDGVSNLLVEVCHNNSSYIANVSVNQTATAFSSTVYYNADATGVCANGTVNGAVNQRPNMRFSMNQNYGYAWMPAAGIVDPSADSTLAMVPATTDYVVMVTDSNTTCVGMDTVNVFARPVPAINLGNDGNFCGTSAVLDAGNPGANYMWSTADSVQMITVTTSGTYSVAVVDSFGCMGSDSVAITFVPFPVVNLGPDVTACQGTSVPLDAGNPGSTFAWSNSATTQTTSVTASGSYSVSITDPNGCPGADTVEVTINPLPTVTLTGNADSVCSVAAAFALSGGSPSGGTYSGPGVGGGSFDPATAGIGSHTITYSFTDANGCTNTSTEVIVVELCVGINDGWSGIAIGIYPNPNDGNFSFTVPVDAAGDLAYEISDVRGQVVARDLSAQPSGVFTRQIDLTAFAGGVYTLRVSVNGKTASKRFVVQR